MDKNEKNARNIKPVFEKNVVHAFTFIFCERHANVTRFFQIERECKRKRYF